MVTQGTINMQEADENLCQCIIVTVVTQVHLTMHIESENYHGQKIYYPPANYHAILYKCSIARSQPPANHWS